MEIQCPQCETLYEVDGTRLQSGTTTLQCHSCQHLFKFGPGTGLSQENERRWMVRHPETGDIRYLQTFDTLHEWIVEREIDQTWEISRTGDKWTTLGTIGEFRPIFQAADNVSSLEADRAVRGPDDQVGDNVRSRLETLDQFEHNGDGRESNSDSNRQRPSPSPSARQQSEPSKGEASSRTDQGPGELPPSPTDDNRRSRRASASSNPPAHRGASRDRTSGDSSGEDDNVQLETGMFGGDSSSDTSAPNPDEEWSMGGGGDGDSGAPDEAFEDELYADDFGRGGGWGTSLAVAAILLLVGGGSYYMFQPSTLQQWWGDGQQAERQPTAESSSADEADDQGGPSDSSLSDVLVTSGDALHEARTSARQKAEAKAIAPVLERAGHTLVSAVDAGHEQATEQAKEQEQEQRQANRPAVRLKQADRAQSDGRSSRARQLYGRVLKQSPGNVEALTGLGWALIDTGQPQKAISKFQQAIENNPDHGDAYIGLGMAHRKLGQSREAMKAYDDYLSRFPDGSSSSIAEYQRDKLRKELGMN